MRLNGTARLVAFKLGAVISVLLAVSALTFGMMSLLPGCIECQVAGGDYTEEDLEAIRAELHLDDHPVERYGRWLTDAVTGDLGRSYITSQPVVEAITARLPVTLELVVLSMVLSIVVSIPLGMATAYRAGGRLDRVVTGGTFGMMAIPIPIMTILLIYIFALTLGWFPATGWTYLTEDLGENLNAAFMPSLALATTNIAIFTRLLRTDMISTLQEEHVLMARAKGLPTWRILLRHALRPSSFSLLTVSGLAIGNLLGGAVIVEQVFALPGIGRLLFQAIFQRDLLVVQGVVLVITTAFVLVNTFVDILYTILDPRIREGSAANG